MKIIRFGALALSGATALAFASPAQAACSGVSFGGDFAGSYECTDLGGPAGVTANLGGLTFLDANTLLIGGGANSSSAGYIASIGVTRGVDGHITGFSGPSAFYASAPNIDGGLAFGPNGVLFATGYSNNTLLQFKPGSTAPDKIINLSTLGVTGSVGTLQFVPDSFGGGMKLASYSSGAFYDVTLTDDGTGTFDVGVNFITTLSGGPEGLVYVDGLNAGFGANSLMVSEYGAGQVGVYAVDANGNPIGPRRTFLTGLSGAEGAVIDPFTGDFLFSTFGGGNRVLVVSGFVAPPAVPEPATWAMMIAGFGMVGGSLRRRRTTVGFA